MCQGHEDWRAAACKGKDTCTLSNGNSRAH